MWRALRWRQLGYDMERLKMERGSGCGEIRDGEGVRMWRDWR